MHRDGSPGRLQLVRYLGPQGGRMLQSPEMRCVRGPQRSSRPLSRKQQVHLLQEGAVTEWAAAQALMYQMAAEKSADFLIVSEYNKADPNWYVDSNNKAAIVNANSATISSPGTSEAGFRWIAAAGMRIYSCYWSPNTSISDYRDFLFRLERSIRTATGEILLAGDFNAKHSDWGSRTNDPRGESLSDMIHALGFIVCNTGNAPTFKTSSIIDVTFCSPGLAGRVSFWNVLDTESLSDHHYVEYKIRPDQDSAPRFAPPVTKWKFNHRKLDESLSSGRLPTILDPIGAEDSAELLTTNIREASMSELTIVGKRKSVHWWSPELNVLRKTANHARRVFQRKRKRMGPLAATAEERAAKDAKLELVKAIKAAKDRAWKALCDQVERDPWGIPYKLVMGKLKRHQPIPGLDSPDTVGRINSWDAVSSFIHEVMGKKEDEERRRQALQV
ncbi:hypothetical protein AGLY_011580 [Aphis glycines]|uniref:Endonuclease/exonuclease/phosphatase domain-containing protein n=1 Tax=Aphis glycines TaxID=307491 RepID=A0A6G0TBX2_APHGL|nr:hypothetical protein AGLY_011580 [Aphis glycines]